MCLEVQKSKIFQGCSVMHMGCGCAPKTPLTLQHGNSGDSNYSIASVNIIHYKCKSKKTLLKTHLSWRKNKLFSEVNAQLNPFGIFIQSIYSIIHIFTVIYLC